MNNEPSRVLCLVNNGSKTLLLPLALTLIVFMACLLGIVTRFDNAMASTWPANALLVGLLLRVPKSATKLGWLGACVAYISADLLTGSSLNKAVLLTLANLISVWIIWKTYQYLPQDMHLIRHPMSVLYMAIACAAGALSAGALGALINPLLFDAPFIDGFILWFVTEYANYVAILPVILCAPNWLKLPGAALECVVLKDLKRDFRPLLATLLALAATFTIGGPGAIGFSVPALLWCAVRYSIFTITLLTLSTSVWALIVIAESGRYDHNQLVSFRLGIPLVALGPIMLACVMQSHRKLLSSLKHLAAHDGLTGTHNRNAFLSRAIKTHQSNSTALAVLMIDIDHFKKVNDRYGHAAGDTVLISVAARLRGCLRAQDLFGRMGGEEFAVILTDLSQSAFYSVAERMRSSIADSAITLNDGQTLSITLSIGLTVSHAPHKKSLEQLLAIADEALYQAKDTGRNQVQIA